MKDKREMWSGDLQPCRGHYRSCHWKTVWDYHLINLPPRLISRVVHTSSKKGKAGPPGGAVARPRRRKTSVMLHISGPYQRHTVQTQSSHNYSRPLKPWLFVTNPCSRMEPSHIYTAGDLEKHELLASKRTS